MKELLITTYREFSRDGGPRLSAALAYFALFATAPALLVAVSLAGSLFGRTNADSVLRSALVSLLGPELSNTMITLAASRSPESFRGAAWVGVGVLLITSALALMQVQAAFNRMWNVDIQAGVPLWHVVRARLAQALIVLLPAALLIAGALSNWIAASIAELPQVGRFARIIAVSGSPMVVLATTVTAFVIAFKYLPDVDVPWRSVLIGAPVTAAAWFLGSYLFGLYMARTGASDAYGVAGSAFVLLVWLNYSARIALVGCKVCKLLTEESGRIEPRPYATQVTYVPVQAPENRPPAAIKEPA
ncbi:MAG: YihY/virulence factor BrkB family protein [Coriobacteriia bacterium]